MIFASCFSISSNQSSCSLHPRLSRLTIYAVWNLKEFFLKCRLYSISVWILMLWPKHFLWGHTDLWPVTTKMWSIRSWVQVDVCAWSDKILSRRSQHIWENGLTNGQHENMMPLAWRHKKRIYDRLHSLPRHVTGFNHCAIWSQSCSDSPSVCSHLLSRSDWRSH